MATMTMPTAVKRVVKLIEDDSTMNAGITAMMQRPELDKMRARLIGIANDPMARKTFDDAMDDMWRQNETRDADEIVIGGGIHAATYCAVRMTTGANKPLVIERNNVGGAFGVSRNPSFYLNSSNRPGNLSFPGEIDGSLNVIPGSPIQPSDLSADDYQRNSDLAFCIRASLAMTANVLLAEVSEIKETSPGKRRYSVKLTDGTTATADRVMIATGIGRPREFDPAPPKNDAIYSFDRFMQHIGNAQFPLAGLKRVAVLGGGDGGKVVIEALLGQGPNNGLSIASLDYVSRIDWFGAPAQTKGQFCNITRTRYQGISRFLPRTAGGESRLRFRGQASRIEENYDGVMVDGRPYDAVIVAIGFRGFETSQLFENFQFKLPTNWTQDTYTLGERGSSRNIARKIDGQDVFIIGAASAIPIENTERVIDPNTGGDAVPENSAAIWRYAPRVASLAMSFPIETPKRKEVAAPKANPFRGGDSAYYTDENGNPLFR